MAGNNLELSTAYVSLSLSGRGLREQVDRELAGAGSSAAEKTSKNFSDRLKTLGTAGVKVAGAAIAAGFGVALAKGLGRLTAIENAQAKMRGLGHDTETVDAIMKNALASVKGTAFGLGEAATTAAGAVAAGIKPGEQLEKVLKSVANAAAASGVSMEEMGAIYNKAASRGKAQNDILGQVAERGIPIYQALAKQMGVTSEEVFALASKGKVSFEQFESAMTSASGTVAEEMGKTFTGSLANTWAAFGRVGANLLSGVFDKLAPALQGVTGWLEKLEPVAKRVGQAIGGIVSGAADALPGILERVGYWAREAFDYIRSTALPVIQDFIQGFRDGEGPGGTLRMVLDGIWTVAKDLFGYVENTVIPAIRDFVQGFRDGEGPGGKFRDILESLRDKVGQAFDYVNDTVLPALSSMYDWFKKNEEIVVVVGSAVLAYKGYMMALELWTKAVTLATTIWTGVQKALNAVMRLNPIGLVVAAIAALVAIVIYAYKENETFRRIVDTAWAAVKTAIKKVVDWFKGTAWPWMRDALGNIRDRFVTTKDRVVDAWDAIRSGISSGWDKIKGYIDSFKKALNSLRDRFDTVRGGIKTAWDKLVNVIAGPINTVIRKVNDFLRNLKKGLNKIPGVNLEGDWTIAEISLASGGSTSAAIARAAYASGGRVRGYSPTDVADNIPAWLTAGEYVLPVKAVRRLRRLIGDGGLESLRRGVPAFRSGGSVGRRQKGTGGWLDKAWDGAVDLWNRGSGWVKDLIKSILPDPSKFFGQSWAGQAVRGVISSIDLGSIADFLTDKSQKELGGSANAQMVGGQRVNYPGHPYGWASRGMPWQSIWGLIQRVAPEARMTSNVRPGAMTASGIKSLHSLGRAVDIVSPNMSATFNKLLPLLPWSQLYYSPMGGRQIGYRDNAVHRMHFDHIHAAFARGGMVGRGKVKPFVADSGVRLSPGLNLVDNKTGGPEPLGRLDRELKLSDQSIGELVSALEMLLNRLSKTHARQVSQNNHAIGAGGGRY